MTASTLANEFATDTMGLILRIERRRLGPTVRAIFDAAEAGNVTVYVPAMVFAEVLYLSEKQKIDISLSDVAEHLTQHPKYQAYPMSFAVVQTAAQITDIRELHDRLIAGTARLLDRALITNDPIIQASAFVQTVW
jgi:predicted nucleic acid-binding protein